MLIQLFLVDFAQRLAIIHLSVLVRSSKPVIARGCGFGGAQCVPRLTNIPCPRCIRLKETTRRCRDQKWNSLCDLPNAIRCATTANCVLPQWIMDGKDDCADGSDEEPCRLQSCTTYANEEATEIVTTSTPWITPSSVTPSSLSTSSFSPLTTTVRPSSFLTSLTTKYLTRLTTKPPQTTTLVLQLPTAIPNTCDFSEFRCLSGECVDGGAVLDGKRDCYDNSDEDYCSRHAMDCSPDQPCSYQRDVNAFLCGCPRNFDRNPRGLCEPVPIQL
ncbi:hypothetical protein Q1695_014233 [Nippostrongylus brasiliensis]|nr:hypothetical protein Q1695_014233 [Nippostrongylus brasiliensis]